MKRRRNNYRYEIDYTGIFIFFCIFFIYSIFTKYYLLILIISCLVLVYIIVRIMVNKDIFGNFKDTILYYNGNSAEKSLEELSKLEKNDTNEYKINCIKKGINGENKLLYVLEYSDIPMYIMHDITLKIDNHRSQIDFIVITKRNVYIIEAKDLNGNLDIEQDGTFTRIFGRYKKGIKNPLTQNYEHELTINKILKREKIKLKYKSIVVLTNDYTYIKYKRGSKDKFNNVLRNDQLYNYLNNTEKKNNVCRGEKKIKFICDKLLKYNIE